MWVTSTSRRSMYVSLCGALPFLLCLIVLRWRVVFLQYTYYTMATVGFGDIVATNTQERIAALVLLVLGASVFGFIVGSVSQLAAAIATEGLAARSNTKLSDVKSYLVSLFVPLLDFLLRDVIHV